MENETKNTIRSIYIPETNEKIESVHLKIISGENPEFEFIYPTFHPPLYIPIITGIFTGIGEITFLNCNFIGHLSGASGNVVKYNSLMYFTGYNFKYSEKIEFDQIKVNLPTLVNWINHRIITSEINDELRKITISRIPKRYDYSINTAGIGGKC